MKSANHLGGLASAITLVGNTMRRPGYAAPKALWLARMSPNLVGGNLRADRTDNETSRNHPDANSARRLETPH